MELSGSNIKKFPVFFYISKKENSLYFKNEKPQKTSYISESNFSNSKNKKIHLEKMSYTSGNENSEKTSYIFSKDSCSYISGNGNTKKVFILQEVTLQARKMKKLFIFQETKLSNLQLKQIPKCKNQTFFIFLFIKKQNYLI